ncbi:MAG: TIGR03663 family protein [Halobacteriales archaeon]|nr:TIGR03663 family protein [Halobacteriales archaeon]
MSRSTQSMLDRIGSVPVAIIVLTGVSLLARLVILGDRIAHWDEGRVAFGILRYQATGMWEYRPIVHGPFLPQVNKFVFEFLGPTDASSRLIVAVIGGLLPLAAWLYRDYLRDIEVIGLAALLTLDPILLYYSRFMRNDVLTAGFVLIAVGMFLRLLVTRRHRYLYGGVGAFAFAFTTKENAILYVLCLLGGLVLLADHRLFLNRQGTSWIEQLKGYIVRISHGLWPLRWAIVFAAVEFLLIIVYFYAPRGGAGNVPGLWTAIGQPAVLPTVVWEATYGSADKMVGLWISGNHQDHAYLPFLANYLRDLGVASGSIAFLAVVGFITDRYSGDRPRDIVAFGFYWGLASVLGYPIVTDIKAAWTVVHAIVPLMLPAVAGLALFYDWGREAAANDDRIGVALTAVVVLFLVGQLAVTGVTTSYLHPQSEENPLVQFAQPEGRMRPALDAIEKSAPQHDGMDVIWYGEHYNMTDESKADTLPVAGGKWYNRLPMPWYLEAYGATRQSTAKEERLVQWVETEQPPVVLTRIENRAIVRSQLQEYGYEDYTYEFRQFNEKIVFFIHDRYAP